MELSHDYKLLLSAWLRGSQPAIQFIETVFSIAHLCDDLTDRDKSVTTAQMQEGFWKALIELPRNAFYVEHFSLLNGAMQVAFLNWQIANTMELREEANAHAIAFVLRSSYCDLITLCAWIVGGTEWACQVGYQSRLRASGEGMDAYLASLAKEHRVTQLVEG